MKKKISGIMIVTYFCVGALQVEDRTIANVGAIQVTGSSRGICEQGSVTYNLKNNGSAPVDGVQARVFMVVNGNQRIAADDWFAITGIGSYVKAGNTCELLVRLVDTDGLPEDQKFIIAITVGDKVVELPLKLSSNNK
ncbi:MAG: hypothetical protein LBE95_02120 [Holosporaceae bacterium]|jgi:hypothetical protein|nr:hypothetical protein [Holosporaceae bacterium]